MYAYTGANIYSTDTQSALRCGCSISARTTNNVTTNIRRATRRFVFASLIICNDSILSFPPRSLIKVNSNKNNSDNNKNNTNTNNNESSSSSFSLIMPNDSILRKACDLVWLMPTVTYQQAMELVGIQKMEASSMALLNRFQWQLKVKIQDRGQPKFSDDDAAHTQRYKDLFHLLGGHNCSLTHNELLRHVGVTKIYKEGTKSGTALSQRLGRWRNKEIKQQKTREAPPSIVSASASAFASVSASELTSNFSTETSLSSQMNPSSLSSLLSPAPAPAISTDAQSIVSPISISSGIGGGINRREGISFSTSASASASSSTSSTPASSSSPSTLASTLASTPASTPASASASASASAFVSVSDTSDSDDDSLCGFVPSAFIYESFQEEQYRLQQKKKLIPLRSASSSNNKASSSLESITNQQETRRTVHQANKHRKFKEDVSNLNETMHVMGSTLLKHVIDGKCNHERFSSPDDVASFINEAFGVEALCGRQLLAAVKDNRAGQPPPTRGRPTEIDAFEFELLASLFFTLSKIEQANGDRRLTRSELASTLGDLVNSYRRSIDKGELNEEWLMKRIEKRNSIKQEMKVTSSRESYRMLWLTYDQLLRNYMRWEDALCELGFARRPVDDEEEKREGYVVFHKHPRNQMDRIFNMDEVCLYLDGKAERGSGREASTPSCADLPETGKGTHKSSLKVTVQFGIVGDQFIPGHVIVSSTAAEGNAKLDAKMFPAFQEIVGQYGYSREYTWPFLFSVNKSGGTTKKTWKTYILERLVQLFPDATDVAGYRLMVKADFGTGRGDATTCAGMKLNGVHLFPGLPNSTEGTQEMDKLYAAAKGGFYSNRDRLFDARRRIAIANGNGEKARLTLNDIGYIIFGGTVKLEDGSTIELENVVEQRFSVPHIQESWRKCGYRPATRKALTDDLVRHNIVLDEEGEIDLEGDPMGEMFDLLEKENHRCVATLEEKGWELASTCKRFIQRVVPTSTGADGIQRITRTVRGTREHQDLLEKYGSAGVFYRVNDGGWVLTSVDMLLAQERKLYLKPAAARMKREKNAKKVYTSIVEEAIAVFAKPYCDWKKPDFVIAVLFKQGPVSIDTKKKKKKDDDEDEEGDVDDNASSLIITSKVKAMNEIKLKELYETKYKDKPRDQSKGSFLWTEKDDETLFNLEQGVISDYRETQIYGDAINAQIEFLTTKHNNLSFSCRKKIWEGHSSPLSDNQRKEAANVFLGISNSDVATPLLLLDDDDDNDDESLKENYGPSRKKKKVATKKKKATTTANTKKKKKKATAAVASNDSDDNLNSDDDSFREEESIASKDSLILYDGPTDDEEEEDDGAHARMTRRKKNTRPTRTCTRTPIIDGEDDEKEDQSDSDASSDTGRGRTRRGVAAVETTASMIADLKKKEEESDEQAAFEKELSKMWLKKAKEKLEEGGTLTIAFLKALIKSKGSDPPEGSRRAPFEEAWYKVKDDADWKRTAFFNEHDKKTLELLEGDNSEDEE